MRSAATQAPKAVVSRRRRRERESRRRGVGCFEFLISKWWGFVHSRWYYLLFRCLFYTQKWCLWCSKTNIFLQNIMQPTYLFNRNKKRTLVAYSICGSTGTLVRVFKILPINLLLSLSEALARLIRKFQR